ncbi:MAG: LytTR family DNA-binding domain-containing protein, partial [Coriobacteriales bacterium]|nr:LytTR family DNA-binding domain-containing protein [Coriobacteriales bacterium]
MLRVKAGHKDRLINISTIAYLESSLHKVIIHCRSNSFETYAKLDELQAQLPDSFTRCHRSYVVNLAFVSSLNEGELRLHDGTTLPISRRRAHQVQHDLLAYLSSHA